MAGYNPKAGARDMLLSLAVLLVPIVLIVWFFQQTPDEPPLPAVDWKSTVATARADADFAVVAPSEIPPTWRVTSSYWERGGATYGDRTLTGDEFGLGMLDNDQRHLQLRQSSAVAGPWLKTLMRDAHQLSTVAVEGNEWTTWESADGRTFYLTRAVGESTVLLSSDYSIEPLLSFAAMLDEG